MSAYQKTLSIGQSPGGQNKAEPEESIWVAHPSALGYLPHMVATCVAAGAVFPRLPELLQRLIWTTGFLPWTQDGAEITLTALRIGIFLPVVVVVFLTALLRLTRFELTTQRLRVCRGLFMRRHDEIALHRIRDYVVCRPFFGLLFGFGSIRLITRDPSLPTLEMPWLPDAAGKTQLVRRHALIWKERMGYREFDSGELS